LYLTSLLDILPEIDCLDFVNSEGVDYDGLRVFVSPCDDAVCSKVLDTYLKVISEVFLQRGKKVCTLVHNCGIIGRSMPILREIYAAYPEITVIEDDYWNNNIWLAGPLFGYLPEGEIDKISQRSSFGVSSLVDAEFFGGGQLPTATPEPIVLAAKAAHKLNADLHMLRLNMHDQTKYGGAPFNINEIMLVAGARYCWNPEPDMDDLWEEWCVRKYGHQAAEMLLPILKQSYELMCKGFAIQKLDVLFGWHLAPKAWLGKITTNWNRFDLFRKPGILLADKTEYDEVDSGDFAAWQCRSKSVPIAEVRNDQREAMTLIECALEAVEQANPHLKSDDSEYLQEIYTNAQVILEAVMRCCDAAYATQIMLDNYDNVNDPQAAFEEALKNLEQYADVALIQKGVSFLDGGANNPPLHEALRQIADGYRKIVNERR